MHDNSFSRKQQHYPQIYLHECLLVWICRRIKKIQQYEKIDVLEAIGINKSNNQINQKHLWFVIIGILIILVINLTHMFLTAVISYQWWLRIRKHCNASNGCQDISMMIYRLENIAILNLKVVYYRYILWNQYAK